VYIGICDGTTSVPQNLSKKLILIFAPASKIDTGSDLNYYIFSAPFDANNPSKSEILNKDKEIWIGNYIACMPLETIDSLPDNQFPSSKPVLSDTRFVSYCAKDLLALRQWKDYTVNSQISDKCKYPNRILVQFEFTSKSSNSIFYLDTIPGFIQLKQDNTSCPVEGFYGSDNGQLCPTVCH
jgi:hypothetical protein